MIIRLADKEDSPSIQSLSLQLGYDYPADKIRNKIEEITQKEDHIILVAVDQESNRVIGFAHAQIYDVLFHDTILNLLGIVIDDSYRSCGIGTAFLNKLEGFSQKNGCHGIRVNSGSFRIRAHDFYLKNGYDDVKEQKRFFKKILPEVV